VLSSLDRSEIENSYGINRKRLTDRTHIAIDWPVGTESAGRPATLNASEERTDTAGIARVYTDPNSGTKGAAGFRCR
jgi:hypothetical protein